MGKPVGIDFGFSRCTDAMLDNHGGREGFSRFCNSFGQKLGLVRLSSGWARGEELQTNTWKIFGSESQYSIDSGPLFFVSIRVVFFAFRFVIY